MKHTRSLYHALSLFTAIVWGGTFVSTKMLINDGLEPVSIFVGRFAIAYICTLAMSHRVWFARSLSDELLMLLAGVTGGSLYFVAENTALQLTYAENVSLIICSTPILTIILGCLVMGDRINRAVWIGSLVAFVGVGIVELSSPTQHGFNPLGDILTVGAALLWAVYSLVIKKLSERYDNTLITRKVFFYGLVTALIYFVFAPTEINIAPDRFVSVGVNLIYLGVLASFVCYLIWNAAVRELGAETTSNYIYLQPIVTITASVALLGEPLTAWLVGGAVLVIGGVALSVRQS